MQSAELIYQVALTITPQIGCVAAKKLIEHFGSAQEIFSAKESSLSKIDGIGPRRAKNLKAFQDFSKCENELKFIEKNNIQALFLNHPNYPKRLLHCYDPPTLLYYRGNANLNTPKTISIIGTRNCTDYGKAFTEQLVKDLSGEGVVVISGMAYGIDTIAHKASVKNNVPTIGVLAHGLDKIYPPENKLLAAQMVQSNGGLLSEFMSDTKPDKHNFPTRNRIVAALSDAVIVVETDIRGGSMITAEIANNYNRDVFAVPGRYNDDKSRGCNHLIRNNKAALVSNAKELLEMMNWQTPTSGKKNIQRSLFVELSNDEKLIYDLLANSTTMHIDEVYLKSGFSSSTIAGVLLSLELQNIITSLPGKQYKLL